MGPRKFIRNTGRAIKRTIKKRYNIGTKKRGGINVGQIARDVANMATMINAEKKYISSTQQEAQTLVVVGQFDYNSTGIRVRDLCPIPAQGNTVADRQGNSIKLHSTYLQFQIYQQLNTSSPIKFRVELWQSNNLTVDTSLVLPLLYNTNPFTGIIDFHSSRNPDHMIHFTKVGQKTRSLNPDQLTGQIMVDQFSMPIKWNKGKGRHIRYTGASNTNYLTDVQSGQIFLIYLASNGNSNAVASTNAQAIIQTPLTGITMRMSYRHYFYDN